MTQFVLDFMEDRQQGPGQVPQPVEYAGNPEVNRISVHQASSRKTSLTKKSLTKTRNTVNARL
jgi:hypothetical protein